MPRPWNLAPPRARRASGAHLLLPPPRDPRAAPPPRLLPTRPFTPGSGARGSRGWQREEAAGPRSSWVQGRAGGLLATGRAHRRLPGERSERRGPRRGGGVGGTEAGVAPSDAGARFRGAALRVHALASLAAATPACPEGPSLVFSSQLFLPNVKRQQPTPGGRGCARGEWMESKTAGLQGRGLGVAASDGPPSFPNQALLQKQVSRREGKGQGRQARADRGAVGRGGGEGCFGQLSSALLSAHPHSFVCIENFIFVFDKRVNANGG